VGVGRRTARKRAVGTRERIIAYLTEGGALSDINGMASTQLAAAVGYPGSSVAFAQLLSGMERSGLIEREVRGKRTYRISLGPAQADGTAVAGGAGLAGGAARAGGAVPADRPGREGGPGHAAGPFGGNHRGGGRRAPSPEAGAAAGAGALAGTDGFDYDELARRLLVQVVRRLAATDAEARLAEENVRLREQLRAAQRSLALAAEQVRRLPASTDLDSTEVVLLQRLLAAGGPDDSGQEGFAEERSLLG
jgi:hypothetical protein